MIEFADACCGKLRLSWQGPWPFCAADIRALPTHLPGVYVLSAFTPMRRLLVPVCVGHSAQLRRQLLEHPVRRSFAKYLRGEFSPYFSVAMVSDPLLRVAAKAALIRCLRPPGNDLLPDAPRIPIDLPSLSLVEH